MHLPPLRFHCVVGMLGSNSGLCTVASWKNFAQTLMGGCLVRVREMENISTFGNFVSTVSFRGDDEEQQQKYRLPSSPSIKCNLLR
jgi:hypothetical protein